MRASNHTETQVELKGVHLCCGGCVAAVTRAVASVPGGACQCDMDNRTVHLTAADDRAAQKALDAIAAAGLHGETDNENLAIRPERNIPPGKVRKVTVSGIHNCCQPCYEAIKTALDTVKGITGDTVEPEKTTFEVTGHFEAAALIEALNAAGFHARVKE